MNAAPTLSRRGFVLVGGRSSRMGTDKALLRLGGQTLLERALAVLRGVCREVAVAGDPARFASYAVTLPDVFPACGPLSGIHAALRDSPAELNFVLAVDMPNVSTELVAFLLALAAGCDAVVTVPRTGRGFQPLCAVYRPSFATVAEQALRTGRYKIDALFAGLSIRAVGEPELMAAGFSEQSFVNLNTPEDVQAAQPRPSST